MIESYRMREGISIISLDLSSSVTSDSESACRVLSKLLKHMLTFICVLSLHLHLISTF